MADGLLELPLARKLLDVAERNDLDLRAALAGDEAALKPTQVAQPALYLVETVLASVFPRGVELLGTAGHSVGEYAAVVAAGALDAAQGMELVIARGRAMASMRQGSMAALLGIQPSVAEEICIQASDGDGVVVVANLNAPGQVVISGSEAALARAVDLATQRGVRRVVPLNVSGAFHSPLMAAAAEDFEERLDAVGFKDTHKIPVVANVDASANTRAEDIRSHLRRQLLSPVRWSDCVVRLCGLGVDVLTEVGPGSVLTGLARRISPGVDAISISTIDDMRGLVGLVSARTQ